MGGLISSFWETVGYTATTVTATPQEPSPELDFKWKTVEPPPELDFKWKTVGVDETVICQDQDLPTTDLVLLTANKHEFEACYKFTLCLHARQPGSTFKILYARQSRI